MASTTQTQTVQVTCINLAVGASGHEAISHIGGTNWRLTKAQAIAELESPHPRYSFFTQVQGKVAWVGVRNGPHGKHLQTHADGYWNNNLLALPICG